jgi:tetratricopeptide (TPR) repeat protein
VGFAKTTCPACKGEIQVPDDRETAKCMLCGHDIDVVAALGAPQPSKVANLMKLALVAEETGNHDEAYGYFSRILEAEPENADAWFGKAVAAGWDSDLRRDRFRELEHGIKKAVALAGDDVRPALKLRAAEKIREITVAFFRLSLDHTKEYIALDDTWEEHLARCTSMLGALRAAHELDPRNQEVLKDTAELARLMLEGLSYEDKYDRTKSGTAITKVREIPPEIDANIGKVRDEAIRKLREIDPSYQATKVNKASDHSAVSCLVGLVIVGVVAAAGYYVVTFGRTEAPSASAAPVQSAPSTPSLVGTWLRVGDPKAGMKVEVVDGPNGLVGTVVERPQPHLLAKSYNVSLDKAQAIIKCYHDAWPLGVTKWKSVKEVTPGEWSLIDRGQGIILRDDLSCEVNRARGEVFPEATLTLDPSGVLTLGYKGKGDDEKQTWQRVD